LLAGVQTRAPQIDATTAPESIGQQTSLRTSLLIFEIRTKIAKKHIEWMAARIDRAFDTQEKIELLLIMTHYDGAEIEAVFNGEAAAVMMRSLAHVRRYGVFGAPAWARGMIELFKWATPVEEKTFSLCDLEAARQWIERA